jgi:UDP-glucose 4-epimerase
MAVAVITGAAGLIGSEAALFFAAQGFDVVGVDNDLRRYFFGEEASTAGRRQVLEGTVRGYRHVDADIRDAGAMERLFAAYGRSIALVIHTAAQPSHDWAAREPFTDFTGPASNCSMLEAMAIAEQLTGRPMAWTYNDCNRAGDHVWWVSDVRKFSSHYPGWRLTYSLERTLQEIHGAMVDREIGSRAR